MLNLADVFEFIPKIRNAFDEYFSLFFLGWVLINFDLKEQFFSY